MQRITLPSSLNERGCEVTVYPAHTTAEEIIASNPDGIMLSNGPGDPEDMRIYYRRDQEAYMTLIFRFLQFVWDISLWHLQMVQRHIS